MNRFDKFFEHDKKRDDDRAKETHKSEVRGLPGGSWVDDGVYRVDSRYRIGSSHGLRVIETPEFAEAMCHFGASGPIIFLDLETTGLSGGTGTYAFLCGLGWTEGDHFNVTQLFLEGPAKERAWLAAICSMIPATATLATYNGKTFDLPLLATRHIMTRLEATWKRLPHIDLLHFARRLYRGYLSSCSLGSMEKNVLRFRRSGEDIPGAMIPAMYYQYLRSGDASPLRGVFYHNELDIVSLAVLYSHIDSVLRGRSKDGREVLRAGDIWHSRGMHERAEAFWNAACGDDSSAVEARARRAYRAKKAADYASAREDFLFVLDALERGCNCTYENASYFSICEELAKIEEHRFKSPNRAAEHVRSAAVWLKKNRYLLGGSYGKMQSAMRHRLERLERKMNGVDESDEN